MFENCVTFVTFPWEIHPGLIADQHQQCLGNKGLNSWQPELYGWSRMLSAFRTKSADLNLTWKPQNLKKGLKKCIHRCFGGKCRIVGGEKNLEDVGRKF